MKIEFDGESTPIDLHSGQKISLSKLKSTELKLTEQSRPGEENDFGADARNRLRTLRTLNQVVYTNDASKCRECRLTVLQ